jgi:LPS export ABC transporter protein LptC
MFLKQKISFLLFNILFALTAFGQNLTAVNATGAAKQRIKDFYLSNYKENGLQDWEVRGDYATIYDKDIDIDVMKATYYTTNDEVKIMSDVAKLSKENMNIFLRDNVHIENRQGISFDTNRLNWHRNENIVETDDWVRVGNKSVEVKAKGFTADTALQNADFEEDVNARFVPGGSDKKPVIATSVGPLKIDYNKGRAVFIKDVVIESEQAKIFCDKAVVFFDAKNKRMVKIICIGKVKILKEENVTYARKATYFAVDDRLTLEGRPKVIYFSKEGDKSPHL